MSFVEPSGKARPWAKLGAGLLCSLMSACVPGVPAQGQPPAPEPAPPPAMARASAAMLSAPQASQPRPPAWMPVPRVQGRLTEKDIGLVINTADPYSVEVGEYYMRARKHAPAQVLRLALPVRSSLTPEEFRAFDHSVTSHFGASVQGLALAWVQPYAVNCNSITGAIALGYDGDLCKQSCAAPLRHSPYFNSPSTRPYSDLGVRASMLLAAPDATAAKAMIDRGVASDRSQGLRGGPAAKAYFVRTPDALRSVRSALFPPAGRQPRLGIDVRVETTEALEDVDQVLIYMTGMAQVQKLDRVKWLPGALADHLTSYGGVLEGGTGQMSAMAWIASGATASFGTVSEPCAHVQKFPHPQLLLLHYAQGSTALEAYWKSVAWPQQGVFIGEPLAAPFSRR